MRRARSPGPWGRIEHAYSRMARDAGIDRPDTHLLREEAVGGWREQARAADVPGEMVEWVGGRIRG